MLPINALGSLSAMSRLAKVTCVRTGHMLMRLAAHFDRLAAHASKTALDARFGFTTPE
jgi:hypothetical protein